MKYKEFKIKFEKEDFNKLKQLDRIEYRQRENNINYFIGYSFICFITFLLFYGAMDNLILKFLGSIYFTITYILLLYLDLKISKRKREDRIKLMNEYSNIKIETK